MIPARLPRIVIVGGGFGGLQCARSLRHAAAQITVIDRTNYSLFQPLLYQAASSVLSTDDISVPIRSALRKYRNIDVLMSEVEGIDLRQQRVVHSAGSISYDFLVLATGSKYNYFGHDEWSEHAPSLKTAADAERIRHRILSAFELAEGETDPERIREFLTFVLVGAGPTGVEMAGTLATLSREALIHDFRKIRPASARIILVEALPRILSTFDPSLSAAAQRRLERMGVEVRLGAQVRKIEPETVHIIENPGGRPGREDPGDQVLRAHTIIWTAGIYANPVGKWLGVPVDKYGRVSVGPDLTVPGHPEIFVIGDAARFEQDGKPLGGVAQVAIQQGRHVAKVLRARMAGREGRSEPGAFRYFDRGYLAVVGRNYAIGQRNNAKIKGYLAWWIWLVVHLIYNLNLKNKILVLVHWAWTYLTNQRTVRTIDPDRDIAAPREAARPRKAA